MWEVDDEHKKIWCYTFLGVIVGGIFFLVGLKSCNYATSMDISPKFGKGLTDLGWMFFTAIFGLIATVGGFVGGIICIFLFILISIKLGVIYSFLGVGRFFDLLKLGRFRYLVIAFFLSVIGTGFIFLNFYGGEINGAFFRNTYNYFLDWIGRQIN
jgi:hypothetical protein